MEYRRTQGKIGNVFHTKDIEAAAEKGALYDPEVVPVAANPLRH